MGLNVIAVSIASGRPTFGHAELTVFQIAFFVAWLLLFKAMAASTDALEQLLRDAVGDGFRRAHLTVEQAAAIMGVDYFNLQKALKGERGRAIPLCALFRLPPTFWTFFLPDLTYLLGKKWVTDMAESLDVRRAS